MRPSVMRPLALAVLLPLALAGCREGDRTPFDRFVRPDPEVVAGAIDSALVAASAPLDSTTVVPGQRLGRVRLGMAFDSLLVAFGQPPRALASGDTVWGAWPRRGGGWLDVFAAAPAPAQPYVVFQVRADAEGFDLGRLPAASLARSTVAAQYPHAVPFGADGLYDERLGVGVVFDGRGKTARVGQVLVAAPGTRVPALRNAPDGP